MTAALEMEMNNEMEFIVTLRNIINHINNVMLDGNESNIDSSKVDGNEIYVKFCELHGNEQDGWKWRRGSEMNSFLEMKTDLEMNEHLEMKWFMEMNQKWTGI